MKSVNLHLCLIDGHVGIRLAEVAGSRDGDYEAGLELGLIKARECFPGMEGLELSRGIIPKRRNNKNKKMHKTKNVKEVSGVQF